MEKLFKVQRLVTVLYAIATILVFIFSLFFLTDFKDLFGLELKVNQEIAYFHNTVLQGFNQKLFYFSLALVIGIALTYMLEIMSKVPDLFALIVMTVFLILTSLFCVVIVTSLIEMLGVYETLDFSKVALEGAIEYIPNNRTFIMGNALFSVTAIVNVLFSVVLVASHITYKKQGVC